MKSQVLHHVEVEADLLEVNQVTAMGFSKTKLLRFWASAKNIVQQDSRAVWCDTDIDRH